MGKLWESAQALEKLLALAMAISNDFERFDRQVRPSSPAA